MANRLPYILLLTLVVGACNKETDFKAMSESKPSMESSKNRDYACVAGSDVPSCESISGCQAAFEERDSAEPDFAVCVANPPTPEEKPSSDPSDPGEPVVTEEKPTIEETVETSCQNLSEEYLANIPGKKKGMKKVKICHHTGNGSAITIVIACPALQAHVGHHEDEVGACAVEE